MRAQQNCSIFALSHAAWWYCHVQQEDAQNGFSLSRKTNAWSLSDRNIIPTGLPRVPNASRPENNHTYSHTNATTHTMVAMQDCSSASQGADAAAHECCLMLALQPLLQCPFKCRDSPPMPSLCCFWHQPQQDYQNLPALNCPVGCAAIAMFGNCGPSADSPNPG